MTDKEANAILDALAQYVRILRESAAATSRAEDRATYQSHLAGAAEMFECVRVRKSREELGTLIKREQHAFGWEYLSQEPGARAEAAFAALVRALQGASHAT
jgi:hypothetical protein